MSTEKNLIKTIILSVLLCFTSIHAENIVGIWKLDKENAVEKIDKVITNKDEATLMKMLINNSWQEIEFKKDGTFNLIKVEDITPNKVWEKTDNDVYVIEDSKTRKIFGKNIILSNSGETLFWKNIFDKDGLNLFFIRSSNSKVRTQKEKDKTDLASMIFFDKVYRTKMIKTVNIGDVYYYLGFGKDKSLITITSKSANLNISNMKDMQKLINKNKEYEIKIDNSSLSFEEKLNKKIENLFVAGGHSGFDFKNKKITNPHAFMDIMENYTENGNVGMRRASACKEIYSINKEHLKCNNGVEYFLYHTSSVKNTASQNAKAKTDMVNFDIAKEYLDEKKKSDIEFEKAIKEMD